MFRRSHTQVAFIVLQDSKKGLASSGQPSVTTYLWKPALFDWQVMNINVTGQAVGEHFQLPFVMWLAVALSTIRYFTVFLVAFHTGDLTVFTRRILPFTINIIVAPAACLRS
jgi:hypothetical protein